MLKKLLLLILVIAPLSLCAQDKIAHINAQEIFTKMPEFAEAQIRLQTKTEGVKKAAQGIEDEYTTLAEKFSKETIEPTVAIVADRQKQLDQLEERYRNFLQASEAEIELDKQKELAPIHKKLQDAIKQVGDEHNYLYIVDSAMFMYINASAVDANKLVKVKLGIKD